MRRTLAYRLILALALGMGLSLAYAEDSSDCPSISVCNQRGTRALREGSVGKAIALFKSQATLAELRAIDLQQGSQKAGDPYREAEEAYDNLALAYLHQHEPLRSRAWSKLALRWNPRDRAAQFNLEKAESALRGWRWPDNPEGEYIRYAGRGEWNQIIVESSQDGRLSFCFEGESATGGSPSFGELRGTVKLEKAVAVYTTHDYGALCRLTMRFSDEQVQVKQTGSSLECGFGNGVYADGEFLRVSERAKCPPPQN